MAQRLLQDVEKPEPSDTSKWKRKKLPAHIVSVMVATSLYQNKANVRASTVIAKISSLRQVQRAAEVTIKEELWKYWISNFKNNITELWPTKNDRLVTPVTSVSYLIRLDFYNSFQDSFSKTLVL